jgi:uncharacterized ion transporter superfamily protein YfcC
VKKFFEKHDLVKMVLITILFTLVLTWLIPSGTYQAGSVSGAMTRTGIADLFLGGMMSVSFFLQQIVYIVLVGAFYGVMTKMDGYKKMVENIAKKIKGKEIPFLVLTSLLITVFTSVSTNIFVVLIFVPFIINVIQKLKLDNMIAFATTFGSILIGVLGATYGTEGLLSFVSYLNYYTATTIKTEIAVRAGILLLAIVLFNFFNITHAKKLLSKKSDKEETNEALFVVEESTKKNVKVWPIGIGFIILFILMILGYVDWEANFNLSIFTEFHEWLIGLEIGEHAIISYLLGANAAAFGSWQLYHISIFMGLILLISAFIYRINFDSLIDGIYDGVKKIMKPIGIIVLVYIIFVFMYWSPIVPSIVNWISGETFNPFLSSIAAMVSSFFHVDFGYTGYVLGNLFATYDGDTFNIAYLIYTTINGFVGMFAPTSVVLMAGLSYCDISYKKWFQYVWKFLVGMLICLLVIFALVTYL